MRALTKIRFGSEAALIGPQVVCLVSPVISLLPLPSRPFVRDWSTRADAAHPITLEIEWSTDPRGAA